MKTQFMLIALGIIAVMAVPGAFAEQQDYELDLTIGKGDAERSLTGNIGRTSVDDSTDVWSGSFTIDGKNAQTYNITYLKVDLDIDGNPDGIHIVGESSHKWDRLLDIHMTPVVGGDEFIVTGGFVIVADAYGNESVEPEKIIPIKSGTIVKTIIEKTPKQFTFDWYGLHYNIDENILEAATAFTLYEDNTILTVQLFNSNDVLQSTITKTYYETVTFSRVNFNAVDLPTDDYYVIGTLTDTQGSISLKSVPRTVNG